MLSVCLRRHGPQVGGIWRWGLARWVDNQSCRSRGLPCYHLYEHYNKSRSKGRLPSPCLDSLQNGSQTACSAPASLGRQTAPGAVNAGEKAFQPLIPERPEANIFNVFNVLWILAAHDERLRRKSGPNPCRSTPEWRLISGWAGCASRNSYRARCASGPGAWF
jgi:hypothetical protein